MKNSIRLKEEDIIEQYPKPKKLCIAIPAVWKMNVGAIPVVLLFITTFSCQTQTEPIELIGNENQSIELRITNTKEIYIDNKLTLIDSVGIKISQLVAGFSKSECENYIVNLTIDKEVEIGILSDVQQQLREVNARRIEYVTIQ